ncbi:MAG: pyridoxamine 5'-phosphate oxidase, partial [Verrucomicrobiota bacterium]
LKAFDENGFVFFTNYESNKAIEIEANPNVALLFPWLLLERQVSITGVAERVSRETSQAYFSERPRDSQIGAWCSQQGSVIASRSLLEEKFKELNERFKDGNIPLPDFWGGYRVVPHTIEFWQGRRNRLHDRFRYTRSDGSWLIERLSP